MYFRYSHSPEEHYLIVSARGGLDVRSLRADLFLLPIYSFRLRNLVFADFTYDVYLSVLINLLLVFQVARQARNRLSSAQLTVPATDGTDGPGKRNSKRRPTINRRPSPRGVPEEEEQDIKEEVKVVKVAKNEVDHAPPAALVVPKNVGTFAVIKFERLLLERFSVECRKKSSSFFGFGFTMV